MKQMLLLGDEAIAQGALDAGLSGVYAYPGTPSTEITEYIQRSREASELNVHSQWSANEKTAMEAALGMSYAGKRAMVCMKHVGLNVAADGFVNAAITGVNGGLVVVVADDPSMHSSQNEQDSRYYGKFAMIPILEPANQQEAYSAVRFGFDLSERHRVPVLLRISTRLAHSRAGIIREAGMPENGLKIPENKLQFVLLPSIARVNYQALLKKQPFFLEEAERSPYTQLLPGADPSLGIICSGIAYNYLMENYPDGCPYPVLRIGHYPLPKTRVKELMAQCKKILLLEEGAPFIEEQLRGALDENPNIHGRLDGTVPRAGELNPNIVARALSMRVKAPEAVPSVVHTRPPELCKGCPHIDSFDVLREALVEHAPGRVFSDIGCYTLGALPPFNSINSCVDMGASITMAKGAADAGLFPSVAVIGDSTFTHSGMTGLLDAVIENSPITVFILDNETTAMTGGQFSSAQGRLEDICLGLGVQKNRLHVLEPLRRNHKDNLDVVIRELHHPGLSVIIQRRDCIQTAATARKERKEHEA